MGRGKESKGERAAERSGDEKGGTAWGYAGKQQETRKEDVENINSLLIDFEDSELWAP